MPKRRQVALGLPVAAAVLYAAAQLVAELRGLIAPILATW